MKRPKEIPYAAPDDVWIMADEFVPDDGRLVTVTFASPAAPFVSESSGYYALGEARLTTNVSRYSKEREWRGASGEVVAWREHLRPWNNESGSTDEGVIPALLDRDKGQLCPACGHILTKGFQYCPGCGAKLRW